MFLVNRASDGGMKGRSLCVHTVENATSSSPEEIKKSEVGKTLTRWTVEESECVFFVEVCLAKMGAHLFHLSSIDLRKGAPYSLDVLFCRPYKLV